MEHAKDLVYDVGMHNGDDTAYYLYKGFRVVSIEANPSRVRAGEARFKGEIAAGRVKILPVGVAAESGEIEFFVSTEIDEWSSFDRRIAARHGHRCETIRVLCQPFSEIIAQHGVPYYCKVDIEGADRLCLAGLTSATSPLFISVEMSHEQGDEDIRRLKELGYRRFQCIRQNDHVSIHNANIDRQLHLRRIGGGAWPQAIPAGLFRRLRKIIRPARDGAWLFPRGSSGAFGDSLTGPWLTADQMLGIWKQLRDIDIAMASDGLGEWFDIHAAR